MAFGYQVLGFGSGGANITEEFDYLVIAGGGAGAGSIGGGGGAGGFRTSYPGGTKIEVTGGDTIQIGAGGVAVYPGAGADRISGIGENAFAGTNLTSQGGGVCNSNNAYPAEPNESATNKSVRDGGSGAGGGHQFSYSVGAGNVPPVSPSQGYPAGGPSGNWGASGGGGHGGAGGAQGNTAYSSPGGNGGIGTANSITGASVSRAGGGGGGAFVAGGTGGPGTSGGGTGGTDPGGQGTSGSVNTGGGAGGACGSLTPGPLQYSGQGGSGLVVLRMATASAPANIDCTPGTNTKTTDGSDTVLTFTVTGKLVL